MKYNPNNQELDNRYFAISNMLKLFAFIPYLTIFELTKSEWGEKKAKYLRIMRGNSQQSSQP